MERKKRAYPWKFRRSMLITWTWIFRSSDERTRQSCNSSNEPVEDASTGMRTDVKKQGYIVLKYGFIPFNMRFKGGFLKSRNHHGPFIRHYRFTRIHFESSVDDRSKVWCECIEHAEYIFIYIYICLYFQGNLGCPECTVK